MSKDRFEFKQFVIEQDRCAMKVGTDGILLGAWTKIKEDKHILDIGAGTGVVALMLAQQSDSSVDAVELDKAASEQAQINFKNSPFKNRLSCINSDVNNFAEQSSLKYDLIVSNPPYFSAGIRSPTGQRRLARHTDTLSLTNLIKCIDRLLTPTGSFCLILPFETRKQLIALLLQYDFWIEEELWIQPTQQDTINRILVRSCRSMPGEYSLQKMILEINRRHQYSDDFINLTKPFYLDQVFASGKQIG